jgi:hypothetical protein
MNGLCLTAGVGQARGMANFRLTEPPVNCTIRYVCVVLCLYRDSPPSGPESIDSSTHMRDR